MFPAEENEDSKGRFPQAKTGAPEFSLGTRKEPGTLGVLKQVELAFCVPWPCVPRAVELS